MLTADAVVVSTIGWEGGCGALYLEDPLLVCRKLSVTAKSSGMGEGS